MYHKLGFMYTLVGVTTRNGRTYRKVGKGDPQVVSVFGVETSVVYEIDATSDDVARREGGAVGLTRAG